MGAQACGCWLTLPWNGSDWLHLAQGCGRVPRGGVQENGKEIRNELLVFAVCGMLALVVVGTLWLVVYGSVQLDLNWGAQGEGCQPKLQRTPSSRRQACAQCGCSNIKLCLKL